MTASPRSLEAFVTRRVVFAAVLWVVVAGFALTQARYLLAAVAAVVAAGTAWWAHRRRFRA